MKPMPGQVDRAAGVLLTQACGDALGVPYEFGVPPTGEAVMRGGGLGPYAPGEWSDDTQMAVCIATVAATGCGLADGDALDDVAQAFLDWEDGGASDIGVQTRSVLRQAATMDGGPAQRLGRAAAELFERTGRAAGNGGLMRTAVVGLTRLHDRDATARSARAVAALTHADPLAGDSCVLWSEAIRVAVVHGELDLAGGLDLLPGDRRDQWASWIADATGANPRQFNPNGFTVTALQAAWAAITSTATEPRDPEHLQRGLHAAVRAGDDTDTVAAIAGALLGARYGASAVPAQWRWLVHGWPGLNARDLVSLAVLTARRGQDDGVGWPSSPRVAYPGTRPIAVPHPLDDGVLLGGLADLDRVDELGVDAVVSLCRVGPAQVTGKNHVEVWLLDSEDPADNPHVDFVMRDAARAVATFRDEGKRVLLHCVHAQQRTPTVAIAYARHRGATAEQAVAAVREALPRLRGYGLLWDAATQCDLS